MASPAPPPTARLRPSQAASSASSSSFPTSICGLGSLGDASRVSSVSFRRRPPASPLVRCSQDPGKIEVFNTEGTEQSQGGSTGMMFALCTYWVCLAGQLQRLCSAAAAAATVEIVYCYCSCWLPSHTE
ncbi:Os09g0442800 [Oryza sativa Japonica Group]|jgi:hypothetical protein|uniref:Os09g0442800 protein n=1 Tax=Oryza sativa subsp. japonica TaxID=39947 RepID=A0A0P0XN90_ORYSJ|nr:hypothetical protein EE612_048140 [Oryza sativa]BAT08313.1 Os09g0442800 [Oryza sativa Japonica Group]